MERSIAAKYAARPAARFVHPPARAQESRLGLRAAGSFQAASTRPTVIRRPGGSVLARLRGGWRAFRAARPAQPTDGRPRPAIDDALGALRPRRGRPPLQRRHGAVARLRTSTATSAGGIVVRYHEGTPQFVVGSRRRDRDIVTWTLPKGTPDPGETREETALREVREETGLEVRISRPLDSIEYWFVQGGTRIHKTVHYFLMDPTGGDLGRHDHEFESVRWIRIRRGPAPADLRDRAGPRRPRRGGDREPRLRAGRRPPTAPAGHGGADVTETADAAIHQTPLRDRHVALGAKLIEFGGWMMPVQYARDPRGAPGRPRAGRPVRPVAHGRAVRRRRGGRGGARLRARHEPAGPRATAGPTTR